MKKRTHLLGESLRREFQKVADPKRAPQMQAYMKSSMPYLGVTTPLMRQACKAVFREATFADAKAWREAVLTLWTWAQYREERYAAIELTGVRQAAGFQTPEAMPMYEEMILTGAWWDLVDGIASQRVGPMVAAYPRVMKKMMREWSRGDNLWKRRTSIICQLGAREETDLKLLYDCIEPSLGETEFFLRKAIGWALRQYAWTDAQEITRYVKEMESRLPSLSRREALKNIG
ncbi:MAG TPA: DNA alkylation repair protein [Bryobacteraceae bacterium]|jgi:3-methyladenine DNA glycosylase AlkD